MEKILEKYKQLSETPSDINEHLVTLKKYAEECDTIVEMGVRRIVSTWSFLSTNPKKLISLDLHNPSKFGGNIDEVYESVKSTNIDFSFVEGSSLTYELEPCDLLFIDTWHDYLQLKKELTRHESKVNKYIILHDTVSFGFNDESEYDEYERPRSETNLPKGLWPAVEEFLFNNRNWVVWEKKPNNNGLTILKRINCEFVKNNKCDNKVALISSFCNNQEKIDVLEKNINIIKSHGLDVIVISPFNLPENITSKCDYFFITKDNPILDWPTRSMYAWRKLNVDGVKYSIARTYPDYGFAGLTQIKQLSQISLNFDYNQFFHMIYDIKIDENVINGFYSNKTNNVYPSKRMDDIWAVGLHYMIFNKPNLEKFISNINLETYLGVKNGDAFAMLHSIKDKLGYVIEPIPVEDEIYYYDGFDFFNLSPIEGLKFFIEKNDENPDTIKIFFYDVKDEVEIELLIEGTQSQHKVHNFYLIDLGFTKFNMKPVSIGYNGINYDLTKIIEDIKHNELNIS
jgi:hypothetical protein